ncbi:LysR family transcriptional regulator [Marinomonas sp. RSW2]|uniref:LysR family transcriptional regulator n=1 Tax=Marinomonas maritima TaxID=2940935 RepID=A0ABT5W9M1_9GAMM|nr:LysR family transcriptional regulator [Marinomonas maritima]MDE8601525.1 LysR family transcriptional regulator [Marinomonas maritima]
MLKSKNERQSKDKLSSLNTIVTKLLIEYAFSVLSKFSKRRHISCIQLNRKGFLPFLFNGFNHLLGLPKSNISSAVRGLKKSPGTRLFHRSTRSIILTQDGETYLPQCQTLLAELDAVGSQFRRNPDDVRGVLRVDMPSRFATTVVIPHLADFIENYPNIRLKICNADYRVDPIEHEYKG